MSLSATESPSARHDTSSTTAPTTAELALEKMPLVGILRGLQSDRALSIGAIFLDAGFTVLEVPLNSPNPLHSIALLAEHYENRGLFGAGTVLSVTQVREVHAAGGRLIVTPNTDPAVIACAVEHGMAVLPGFATATEAFAAINAGAAALKLFPASSYGPAHLKALKAVLPASVKVYPVGGVGPAQMHEWLVAGANGFGLGTDVFRPDFTLLDVRDRANRAVAAWRHAIQLRNP